MARSPLSLFLTCFLESWKLEVGMRADARLRRRVRIQGCQMFKFEPKIFRSATAGSLKICGFKSEEVSVIFSFDEILTSSFFLIVTPQMFNLQC